MSGGYYGRGTQGPLGIGGLFQDGKQVKAWIPDIVNHLAAAALGGLIITDLAKDAGDGPHFEPTLFSLYTWMILFLVAAGVSGLMLFLIIYKWGELEKTREAAESPVSPRFAVWQSVMLNAGVWTTAIVMLLFWKDVASSTAMTAREFRKFRDLMWGELLIVAALMVAFVGEAIYVFWLDRVKPGFKRVLGING